MDNVLIGYDMASIDSKDFTAISVICSNCKNLIDSNFVSFKDIINCNKRVKLVINMYLNKYEKCPNCGMILEA